MKRINGFLQLDDYIDDNSIGLVDENDTDCWLKIDNIEYFFKYTQHPYTELICSEIAKTLGIRTASYDLAMFRNYKGVISQSFRKKDCRYVSGTEILNGYLQRVRNIAFLKDMGAKKNYFLNRFLPRDINNLEIIWQAIEYRYNELGINIDIEKIMNDLILLFIFNILALQNDGLPQNWELEESSNGVFLTPIFDNEYCLSFDDFGNVSSKLTTSFKDGGYSNYQILEEFLKISDNKTIILFLNKFEKLTEKSFLEIIESVEKHIKSEIPTDIKMNYINSFNKNRRLINAILENMGISYEKFKGRVNSL